MLEDKGRLFGIRTAVWGAGGGIGEAICRTAAKHGARVCAIADAQCNPGKRLAAVPGVTPLATGDALSADIEAVAAQLGGLDAVVDSLALQPKEPIVEEAAQKRYVDGRCQRLRQLFEASLPHLQKSPAGRVVVLGSLRSAFAQDAEALAAAAEATLARVIGDLAARCGRAGITVNYVQPGAIMTAESRRIFVNDLAFRDYCIRRSAARRLGEPIDVAKVVLFLLSDDATFVSGTGIAVDGAQSRGA